MATWQNTSLIMLRNMLNDAGCVDKTYTNQRLEQLLLTAAYFLPIDVNFSSDYVIDIEARTITPNPVNQSDGSAFINLMVLKAACLLDESNFRTAALLQGVSARCGPTSITTNAYGQYLRELLVEGPCKSYESLKERFNFSYDGSTILKAVMSPFVSNDFNPTDGTDWLDTNNPHRER